MKMKSIAAFIMSGILMATLSVPVFADTSSMDDSQSSNQASDNNNQSSDNNNNGQANDKSSSDEGSQDTATGEDDY